MYPCTFKIGRTEYCCVEQYVQSEKAKLFGDRERKALIMNMRDPVAMRQLGRQVQPFDADIWNRQVEDVVKIALLGKFEQDQACRIALLATESKYIVECSQDKVWGAGLRRNQVEQLAARAPIGSNVSLPGQNKLGELLMQVRPRVQMSHLFSSLSHLPQ